MLGSVQCFTIFVAGDGDPMKGIPFLLYRHTMWIPKASLFVIRPNCWWNDIRAGRFVFAFVNANFFCVPQLAVVRSPHLFFLFFFFFFGFVVLLFPFGSCQCFISCRFGMC